MKNVILAGCALGLLAACATAPADTADGSTVSGESLSTGEAGSAQTILVEKSGFDLAMDSVDVLVAAGNEQTAIDRLMQLIGEPDLTDQEKQVALLKLGTIRMSPRGYDVWQAITNFEEITSTYGEDALDGAAQAKLEEARGKATSLNFLINQPETTRLQKFEAMFALGDHQEAVDLMLENSLTPGNDYLIAMYQIGWLCEGEGFTGPIYSATEPDGTNRSLQFCDFGK